jgi:hypothetical protein
MQLRTLAIKGKTSQKNEKLKRVSNERRIRLIVFLCLPVVFSSSNSPAPVMTMSASRIAETRPRHPIYRSRVTECRYPAVPEVSIVLSSVILLRDPMNASTQLSMNGKSPTTAISSPLVPSINSGLALRLSKDERRAFQQNPSMNPVPREEFFSSLKDCVSSRSFQWSAII